MEYKYSLRYELHHEAKENGFNKDDINEDQGLCDAFLFVSMIKMPEGGYSEHFISCDGRTDKQLTDRDLFKHFCLLAMSLSESENLL
jgi:hypothetical protein